MNSITILQGSKNLLSKKPFCIYIYGEIEDDCATDFVKKFNKAVSSGQKIIPIVIHSTGGDLYDAIHMIGAIRAARNTNRGLIVATIVAGHAYSAAALIFSCGSEGYRFVGKGASIMLHDVSHEITGKCQNVQNEAKELLRNNKMCYEMMAQNTQKPLHFFHNKVQTCGGDDLYVSAEEAKEWNLANHIGLPQLFVKVQVSLEISHLSRENTSHFNPNFVMSFDEDNASSSDDEDESSSDDERPSKKRKKTPDKVKEILHDLIGNVGD